MNRRLAAILAADVVGYSSMMAADETGTLATLRDLRKDVIDPAITEHRGRLVKLIGDGTLVEFASVVDAVNCAVSIQRKMASRDAGGTSEGVARLRIGVSLGDVIADRDDIYGDGVNIAARLETEAAPGGVLISDDAFRQLRGKINLCFVDLGERQLKNLPEPVRVHSVELESPEEDRSAFETLTGQKPVLPDKPSVAVLAFSNMSADPEQEYFSDGITEDIITELSRFPELMVIARNSSFYYKGKSADLRKIARELGVRFVVEGSVRRAGKRVRVTTQLIEGTSGSHVWAERYDCDLDDIFAVQEDITSRIVSELAPRIAKAEERRASRRADASVSSYDTVLKARGLVNEAFRLGSADTLLAAIDMAESALAQQPSYKLALVVQARALAYCYLYRWGPSPDDALAMAAEKIGRYFEIDTSEPQAYSQRGMIRHFQGDHVGAIEDMRLAVKLNPNYTHGLFLLAWAESLGGISGEARAHVERGLRLSPRDNEMTFGLAYLAMAQASFADENYAETRKWARLAIQMTPRAPIRRALMIASCAFDGDTAEAEEHMRMLASFSPDFLYSVVNGKVTLFQSSCDNARLVKGLLLAGVEA